MLVRIQSLENIVFRHIKLYKSVWFKLMPVSDEFIEYVIDQLASWTDVSVRRMFGGAGLYCDGIMFGLIADDIVAMYFDRSLRFFLRQLLVL